MSCIVNERGTPPSSQIFLVFCTRKLFFYFLGISASLASARSRKIPENPQVKKVFFFDFPELHQVPYGASKMTPENSKMIKTSPQSTSERHFQRPVTHVLPLECLWKAFGPVIEMANGRLKLRPRAIRRPRGPRGDLR